MCVSIAVDALLPLAFSICIPVLVPEPVIFKILLAVPVIVTALGISAEEKLNPLPEVPVVAFHTPP